MGIPSSEGFLGRVMGAGNQIWIEVSRKKQLEIPAEKSRPSMDVTDHELRQIFNDTENMQEEGSK